MDSSVDTSATLKRKRDETGFGATHSVPSGVIADSTALPASKSTKTSGASHLSINYLARQSPEDLPLVNKDDALPTLLQLLASYGHVLDRHESLASNLGARPLGPILIKRFERCFDSPPKVVASHHKGGTSNSTTTTATPAASSDDAAAPSPITWLEVIEFARSHPSQFTLSTFSEGKRVCQFYYPQKQLRVQISEEDFLFINSGRCQELIPPLPIWEDEEKEVATCDVLEAKLKELTNAADVVAARTRQLSHRLKGRRAAILERRAVGGSGTPAKASAIQTTTAPPPSSGSGFTAVNSTSARLGDRSESVLGSSAVRNDLLRHFESLPQNQGLGRQLLRHPSISIADVPSIEHGLPVSTTSSLSPVPQSALCHELTPRTTTENVSGQRPPSASGSAAQTAAAVNALKHNFSRPLPAALENSQPFRPLCQAHMDSLPRGQRVLPPCDRCRRLRMDCVKNLTSCAGCTKKHARCHWRDVSREELGALDHLMEAHIALALSQAGAQGYMGADDSDDDDDSNPLEDLEALGEKEERERGMHEDGMGNEGEEGNGSLNAKDYTSRGKRGDEGEGPPTRPDGPPKHSSPSQHIKRNSTSKDDMPRLSSPANRSSLPIFQQISPPSKSKPLETIAISPSSDRLALVNGSSGIRSANGSSSGRHSISEHKSATGSSGSTAPSIIPSTSATTTTPREPSRFDVSASTYSHPHHHAGFRAVNDLSATSSSFVPPTIPAERIVVPPPSTPPSVQVASSPTTTTTTATASAWQTV